MFIIPLRFQCLLFIAAKCSLFSVMDGWKGREGKREGNREVGGRRGGEVKDEKRRREERRGRGKKRNIKFSIRVKEEAGR